MAATTRHSASVALPLTKQHCCISAADVLVVGSKACRRMAAVTDAASSADCIKVKTCGV
jgi:hypothetical protein